MQRKLSTPLRAKKKRLFSISNALIQLFLSAIHIIVQKNKKDTSSKNKERHFIKDGEGFWRGVCYLFRKNRTFQKKKNFSLFQMDLVSSKIELRG
jgi:hypothetical protein